MVTLLDGDLTKEWYSAAINVPAVGCDIETSGLDKSKDKIATFQMYVPNTGVVMVRKLAEYPTNMIKLLEHQKVRKIFHHAPFDLGFLVRDYYFLEPRRIADTKVAAKILDPKRTQHIDLDTHKGSHSLKTLIEHYFGFKMNKALAVSDWFKDELTPEQLDYAAKDVEYLPGLLELLEDQLKYRGLLSMTRKAFAILPQKVLLDLKAEGDIYGY